MTQIGDPIRRHHQVPDRPPLHVPDPATLPPAPTEQPAPSPAPAPAEPAEQPLVPA